MLRIVLALLLISIILASGCVDRAGETGATTTTLPGVTGAMTEDQALNEIEQEMESAIENISIEDIENSLGE